MHDVLDTHKHHTHKHHSRLRQVLVQKVEVGKKLFEVGAHHEQQVVEIIVLEVFDKINSIDPQCFA